MPDPSLFPVALIARLSSPQSASANGAARFLSVAATTGNIPPIASIRYVLLHACSRAGLPCDAKIAIHCAPAFAKSIMLKVTVEVVRPERIGSGRQIATAYIGRAERSAVSDYFVQLNEAPFGDGEKRTLHAYPRYASSVFDLVARALAVGLTGTEELPPRPLAPSVPIHQSGDTSYVRLREVPEPAATHFRKRIEYSTCPVIEEDSEPMQCAYAADWLAFLSGRR